MGRAGGSVVVEWGVTVYMYVDEGFGERAERLKGRLTEMQERAREIGIGVSIDQRGFDLPQRTVILKKLRESENSKLREEIVSDELEGLRKAYLAGRKERAEQRAEVISALGGELEAVQHNNVGYLRLAQGRLAEAREMFDAGIGKTGEGDRGFGVLSYNRGVVRALEGNQPGALADFKATLEWGRVVPKSRRK
jgi:hypothetical protein